MKSICDTVPSKGCRNSFDYGARVAFKTHQDVLIEHPREILKRMVTLHPNHFSESEHEQWIPAVHFFIVCVGCLCVVGPRGSGRGGQKADPAERFTQIASASGRQRGMIF